MANSEKLYTISEYEAYANAHPEHLFELIDGRIVEKVTNEEHGFIVLKIGRALLDWRINNKVNGYPSTESSHRVSEDEHNERKPDVSFRYTDESASSDSAIYGMPDFAVEVKSLSNTYVGLREKATFYIDNGTRLVWLVYPARQIIEVYFADGSTELFTKEHTLSGGDVLPGFEMAVREIFEG